MLGSVPARLTLSLRSSSARWLSVLMAIGTVPSSLLPPSRSWVKKLAAAMALGNVPVRLCVCDTERGRKQDTQGASKVSGWVWGGCGVGAHD